MSADNDKPWDARLAARLVAPLQDSAVTPNHLTTLRLLFGVLACAAFAAGGFFWSNIAALCFVVSNFLDHSDGELARMTGNMTRFGHIYDLISDALANILLFVGIGLGLRHGALGQFSILLGCLAGAAVAGIFQMRAAIEKSIGKDEARQPHLGAMEAEDVLYLLPIITLFGQLQPFLIVAAIGAPLFAMWTLREFLAVRRRSAT